MIAETSNSTPGQESQSKSATQGENNIVEQKIKDASTIEKIQVQPEIMNNSDIQISNETETSELDTGEGSKLIQFSSKDCRQCKACKRHNCLRCKSCCNAGRKKKCSNRICYKNLEKIKRYKLHHDWKRSVRDQHRSMMDARIKKKGKDNIPEEELTLTSFPGSVNSSSEDEEVRVFIKQHPDTPRTQKKTTRHKLKRQVLNKETVKEMFYYNDKIEKRQITEDNRIVYINLPQPILIQEKQGRQKT